MRKKDAAYHVRRSAVKNFQPANNGMARIRLISPAYKSTAGFRIKRRIARMNIKAIS